MNSKNCLSTLLFSVAFAVWLVPQGAASDSSNSFVIEKEMIYEQTASSGAVADPMTPYEFEVDSPASPTMSFTSPGGASTPVTTPPGNSSPQYTQFYGAQSALDAAFPDGSYTFSVTGFTAFTLPLMGDLYPPVPQVMGGTWNSSGQLVVDPTQSYTFNFSAFPGFATSGVLGFMQFRISPFNGGTKIVNTQAISSTGSAFTSQQIAASTLQPGSIYQAQLEFATGTGENTTSVTGDTAVTLYNGQTIFTIVTPGTASNLPTITQQPTNQTAPVGGMAIFQINWSDGGSVEIQWFKNGVPINSSEANLEIDNIQNSDAGSYFAVLANSDGGYVQSNTVTLAVGAQYGVAPLITGQPASETVATGSTAVFNVSASGSPAPTYQWSFNGGAISGATTSTLLVSGTTSASAGSYTCTATNASGSVTSSPATLTVEDTTSPGRLINISARAFVGTGGNVLIAGFVVQGSASLPVLVRSSGPALLSQNVTGVLPDPQLQLYSGSTNFASNAGWAGNAQIASTAAAVGATAWPNPASLDSALLETLSPGGYTGITSGVSGDTGVSLAEVYDATPSGTYTPSSPRLINISARAFVGTGGNVLIAGFVIAGSTSKTVLIRASGPALLSQGVTGVLGDPQLQLYSGSTVIASNAGWGGNPQIVSVASSVGAHTWSDSSSLDSALLVTLPPGGYTAIISGASGDTGVSLAEVYDVP